MDAITAEAEIDGARWRVELTPLRSLVVTRDGAEVPGATWDRQTLWGGARAHGPAPASVDDGIATSDHGFGA